MSVFNTNKTIDAMDTWYKKSTLCSIFSNPFVISLLIVFIVLIIIYYNIGYNASFKIVFYLLVGVFIPIWLFSSSKPMIGGKSNGRIYDIPITPVVPAPVAPVAPVAPTPGVPTPGVPTPGVPAPVAPTPGVSAPAPMMYIPPEEQLPPPTILPIKYMSPVSSQNENVQINKEPTVQDIGSNITQVYEI